MEHNMTRDFAAMDSQDMTERREESNPLSQMLIEAMLGQKRSLRAYELMIAACNNVKTKDVLATIRREERRHYYFLEGIYEDLTGEAAKQTRLALSFPKHYVDMLKTAICDKLETIDFLEKLTAHLNCVKQRDIMNIILNDQKEHARLLASIYDKQA